MDYGILLAFVTATLGLAISPGPDNIFVLTLSLSNGSKKGLAVVAGLMTGCIIHTTLVAFGVSALIKNNDTVFWGLKILGVGYLLYLCYQVYRSEPVLNVTAAEGNTQSMLALFKKGFIMNVLNPKVTIFFLAFFPGFLFSDGLSEVVQFYILGGVFIIASTLVFGAIALLAGSISAFSTKTPKAGIFFKWLQIVVFLGIALFLLFN